MGTVPVGGRLQPASSSWEPAPLRELPEPVWVDTEFLCSRFGAAGVQVRQASMLCQAGSHSPTWRAFSALGEEATKTKRGPDPWLDWDNELKQLTLNTKLPGGYDRGRLNPIFLAGGCVMRCAPQVVWLFLLWPGVAGGLWVRGAYGEGAASPPGYATWLANLGSGEFRVRQQAMAQLVEAGPSAIPWLTAAIAAGDGEVRGRILEILRTHALSPQAQQREPALAALRALAQDADAQVAAASRAVLEQLRETTSAAAQAELTRLGAVVMPLASGERLTFNVQIPKKWRGGDRGLARLEELGNIPWLSLENAPVTDQGLKYVGRLAPLARLYLGGSGVQGSGLKDLSALQQLEYLSLKQLPLDDEDLARLPEFPNLQYLGLDGTRVSDQGLLHLARYRKLQVLWLDQTPVTDAGLAHLAPLTELKTLYLPGTQVKGPGLAALAGLPRLAALSLRGVRFSAGGLRFVAQLTQLESLGLDQTNVSDEDLAALTSLRRLRVLWLSGTQVGDAGLTHLKELRSLQTVHLSNTRVTGEGAAELQQALPQCQVTLAGRFEPARGGTGRPGGR
jgi:hypothetical protein